MKTISQLIVTFTSLFSAQLLFSQNTIEIFKGEEIIPYVKDISDLSLIIYKEYPYLYEGTEEEYLPFIEYYAQSKESLACMVFDQGKPVGVAIGMPMSEMREKYLQPFSDKRPQEDVSTIYYLGEFLLLKDYRGQGLGKQMYLALEQRIKEEGNSKKICFCKIDESHCPAPLQSYNSLDAFWKKIGYEKCEDITFSVQWRNVNEVDESSHQMVYWIKSFLKPGTNFTFDQPIARCKVSLM